MQQISFSDTECGCKRRQIRREQFLAEMDNVVHRARIERRIEPHYPKAGNGRHPYPLPAIRRINSLQQWYELSDPVADVALYKIATMHHFAHLSLTRNCIPDETTIMYFRCLQEKYQLAEDLFSEASIILLEKGMLLYSWLAGKHQHRQYAKFH